MSSEAEQRHDDETTTTAWEVFQHWTGSRDAARFRASYQGRWDDREAYGQHLAQGLGADARLQRLPEWLRAYLRFDGTAVVADFERSGHIYVFDAPENGGTYVFDAYPSS